ncbi:MAG: maleylpyruvate isomerase family mycothiol-dependent enzyme [Acidimicrobiia bacterium]|nr:maleylpyruvate isomerase family mycothiol-dependent enzyme [Acidimicrobiia bacterium]
MQPAEIYAVCRTRLLELAPTLSEDDRDARLPATPPWTVVDGYRHLAGVCADVLDGVMDRAGTPSWTSVQVVSRAKRSLAAVCDEWSARAPALEVKMAEGGDSMAFLAFDVWTHEQDIRDAAEVGAVRDDELPPALAALALQTFAPRYAKSGAPALEVVVDDGPPVVLGAGPPAVALGTSAYELLRILFGRRSREQVGEAAWTGDNTRALDALHIFDFPLHPIHD